MITTPLLLLALVGAPAPSDTIRLAEVQSLLAIHRPGIRLIIAPGDTTGRLAITVREPQHFETTELDLTDVNRRDSLPVAVLPSDSSSVDGRSNTPSHTLWYKVDLRQLRAWAAVGAPGIKVGKIKYMLDQKGIQRMRAAVGRESATVLH